jgi:formylglycine-generating enzyme required for sulfatase activity
MLSTLCAVVVRGQGGTGRATPTPTPTPKKATPRKLTPAKTTSDSKTSQPAKSTTNNSNAAEISFWNSIKDSKNPEDFRSYLKKYPKGEFVDLARNRLSSLEESASWDRVKDSTSPYDFREFMKKHPAGQFIGLAANRLKTLEEAMTRRHTNKAGIEFVLIPAGSFMMGSTNGDADERPVHKVTIEYPFYMGKYEVTQAQWQAVMGNNPSHFKDCDNCPVEQVSWDDAQGFIRKLNQMNDGYRYRLPTEAEWEYACRAGTTGDYGAGNLSEMAWHFENSGSKTHAVGSKQPNAWSLADMHGNVWEWCEDWYHQTYSGAPTDGTAWLSGGEQRAARVRRGGSWYHYATYLRSANRGWGILDSDLDAVGFRVVAVR